MCKLCRAKSTGYKVGETCDWCKTGKYEEIDN